jgi:hypothetical protein
MRIRIAGLLFTIAASQPLAGQATGLPTFFAPRRAFGSSELGVTISRPGGESTGIEGRIGARLDRADINFRAGIVDPGGNWDAEVAAGVEARIPVIGRSSAFPLDGSFILGVGHVFASGGGGQTFVPLGLTIGRRLNLDGTALQLTPYVQPTMILIDDAFFTLGLGIDLRIRGIPEIRFNSAVGDMDGFSIGFFWVR